ncbi:hypothetical protein N7657_09125 [Pseudomonas monteilii]|nr:hypothetical protein [Pseudomonas monteilii]MDH0021471.1 hypothetical protein [Pseudomonas monteilii]
MNDKASIAADTLELLLMNQTAIRAALEEISLWVNNRGSTVVHENVRAALATLDLHEREIALGIECLRS